MYEKQEQLLTEDEQRYRGMEISCLPEIVYREGRMRPRSKLL